MIVVGIVAFAIVPKVALQRARVAPPEMAPWLRWLAAALFAVSWWLPNPALGGRTGTFTQHAVGGGVACACLALFVCLNLGVSAPLFRIAAAYATAAVLGVLVEMAEVASDELLGTALSGDAAWDLVANSTGAVGGACLLELVLLARWTRSRWRSLG